MENAARQQVTASVRFAAPGRPLLVALLAATRPRQWIKNLLVFAAPMAAGVLSRPADLGRAGAAAVIFVVASAGVYLINDVMDAPADRLHPVKRGRPVASGELPAKVAATAGIAALTLALTASAVLAGAALVIVTAAYRALGAPVPAGRGPARAVLKRMVPSSILPCRRVSASLR